MLGLRTDDSGVTAFKNGSEARESDHSSSPNCMCEPPGACFEVEDVRSWKSAKASVGVTL
jgi:hypothetical protein